MNYAQLTASKGTPGSIATWINSSTIQNDTPEIVLEVEGWIYRRLRHWKMVSDPYDGQMVIGNDFIPLPGPDGGPLSFLEPVLLWTTGQYQQIMIQKPMQEVIANWQYTGTGMARVQQQPILYYQAENSLRFDSPADIAYDYNMIYFEQPDSLANTNTNFLTNTYPRLLRCACMAAAAEWMKDSGQGNYDRVYWDQLAQDEIDKAQTESDRARRGTIAGMILIGGGNYSNFPAYTTGYG